MTATFNYKNNMKSAYKLITKKMNTRQSILLLLSIMVFNVLSYAQPTAVVHVGSQQNVGYTVCFDGSDSFGDGGDKFIEKDEIMNFIWNFGDGTPEESGEYS